MMSPQPGSGRKHGEHCGSNSGNRIQNGACFGAHLHRCGPTFLCVPLERVHAPTAFFERVVSGLIDGRRTLKDTGVEQDFGFSANDGVIGFDFIETRYRFCFKHGPLSTGREIREQEIQGSKQKNVIGKIFVKRKMISAPQIQVGKGTNINDSDNCEWVIDHSHPHEHSRYREQASYRLKLAYRNGAQARSAARVASGHAASAPPKRVMNSPPHRGPKRTCRKTQSMSLLGVKRTWPIAVQMSAYDPKRTFDESHCGVTMMYPRFSILSNVRIPLISVLVGIQTQSALAGLTSRTRNESDSASYAPSGEICGPPRSPTASRRNAIIT